MKLIQRFRMSIPVVSGSGSAPIVVMARVDSIIINPPGGSPTVDIEIDDDLGNAVIVQSGVITPAVVGVNRICYCKSFQILNATLDGTYVVTVYAEESPAIFSYK